MCRSTVAHSGSGGMEQLTHDLASAWTEAGHEVVCVTTPGGWLQAPYRIIETLGPPARYSRRWRRSLKTTVNAVKPDVVISVSGAAHGQLVLKSTVPVLLQAHGTSFDELRTKLRTRRALTWMKAVKNLLGLFNDARNYPRYAHAVAVSARVAQSMQKMPKLNRPQSIEVIENGVSSKLQQRILAGSNSETLTVGYVGRLHHEKGVDRLLRASKSAAWSLQIVGEGPEEDGLRRIADSKARFFGRLPHEQVLQRLAEFDVLVVPSRRIEGLPLVVLEALSLGVGCAVSESVSESFGGELPDGVISFGAADASLRRAVAEAAQQTASLPAEYTIERTASRYLEAMLRLVETRG